MTVDGQMVCPDCGSSSYLLVDGKEMTEYDLLHLCHAPRIIVRRLPHAVWCPSADNRMRLVPHVARRGRKVTMPIETLPPLPAHVPPSETMPRSRLENMHGISYCRRCGRLIAKDSDPMWEQAKPCQIVRVELRERARDAINQASGGAEHDRIGD